MSRYERVDTQPNEEDRENSAHINACQCTSENMTRPQKQSSPHHRYHVGHARKKPLISRRRPLKCSTHDGREHPVERRKCPIPIELHLRGWSSDELVCASVYPTNGSSTKIRDQGRVTASMSVWGESFTRSYDVRASDLALAASVETAPGTPSNNKKWNGTHGTYVLLTSRNGLRNLVPGSGILGRVKWSATLGATPVLEMFFRGWI